MKRLIILLSFFLFFIFPKNVSAFTSDTTPIPTPVPKILINDDTWMIQNFRSDLKIQPDGRVAVTENIDVDFGTVAKHGIFRDIPFKYQNSDGSVYFTDVQAQSILQDNSSVKYQVSTNGNFIEIKIGDPNNTIVGKHTYIISYLAAGILRSYSDHDELYWNATGNHWGVPIMHSGATVTFPQNGITKVACFQGPHGSTDSTCTASQSDTAHANFSSSTFLNPNERLTIVVGFTKGMVPILTAKAPPTFLQQLFSLQSLVIFLVTIIIGFTFMILAWWKRGRDYWFKGQGVLRTTGDTEEKPIGGHDTIVVEYTPPENLRPAEVGVLLNEKATTRDVTATIIDLASRGFLTITEQPKKWLFGQTDYTFKKVNKDEKELKNYEAYLYDQIFESGQEVELSSLRTNFYTELKEVEIRLYKELVSAEYFPSNPDTVRLNYRIVGIVLCIAGFFLAFYLKNINSIPFGAGLVFVGIFTFFIAGKMSRRTAKGHEMYRRILGYRLFISEVESYKQKFFEKKNMFNEILPYTIVFGLTEKFAKALQDMGVKPSAPTWYYGYSTFYLMDFSSRMNSFSDSFGSAIAAVPSKSGGFGSGGFSGGGFGGGGGGSW